MCVYVFFVPIFCIAVVAKWIFYWIKKPYSRIQHVFLSCLFIVSRIISSLNCSLMRFFSITVILLFNIHSFRIVCASYSLRIFLSLNCFVSLFFSSFLIDVLLLFWSMYVLYFAHKLHLQHSIAHTHNFFIFFYCVFFELRSRNVENDCTLIYDKIYTCRNLSVLMVNQRKKESDRENYIVNIEFFRFFLIHIHERRIAITFLTWRKNTHLCIQRGI